MTNKKLLALLRELNACGEAVIWVGSRDLATAWAECEQADWMLWLCGTMAGEMGWPSRLAVALAAIKCGRLSLDFAGGYRARLSDVFDVAERCARKPTPKNIASARAAGASAWAAWASAHKKMRLIIRKELKFEQVSGQPECT